MAFGALRDKAKGLRVPVWINGQGKVMDAPVRLADLGDGYKIVFCFQDWCPGCHSRGFPTLKRLYEALKDREFGFAVIQTVFEGADKNTFDRLRPNQERYGLDMPFGHDIPLDGDRYPSFMEDYRTAGTPWFTVIDPQDNVVFADFSLDADRLIAALDATDAPLDREG